MERSPVSVLTVRTGLQHRTTEDSVMQANRSTVVRLGTALVTASTAGLAGRAAREPTHESIDGADGGAVLDLNVS